MTKEIRQMRERAAEIATEARALLDTITDGMDAGQITEIEGRFDTMMQDHDKLQNRADREQRLLDAEQRGMPSGGSGDPVEGRQDESTEAAPEYRDTFYRAMRFGVSALSPEERQLMAENRAQVTPEMRAQAAGTDSAGGYTVPEGFSGELDKALAMWGPMWDGNIVRELVTTSGNRIPWPTVDDTAVTGGIKAENAAATDDGGKDVTFGEKQLDAYVYDTEIVRIPMELMQDSAFNLEAEMVMLFSERLGRTANTALTTGTGSSQPNGVVTAAGAGITAASATAITPDELIDLFHSVDPAYRQSPWCRWMFSDSTLKAIRKMKDGDGNYLWQMGDIRVGEPDSILGKPYSINQAVPAIEASAKSVVFGDFSRYVVRKVADMTVLTLRERYAEFFQVGMIGFKRFDGELLNTAAIKAITQAAS